MTSILNDDLSTNKMDRAGKKQYPGERGFSVPSIKPFSSKNGISSRISTQFVSSLVSGAVKEVG